MCTVMPSIHIFFASFCIFWPCSSVPVKNKTLVNATNQKAQINVSGAVTVAIPDGGGTGISNVVGNGPGGPGTITVGNAITQSFATAA